MAGQGSGGNVLAAICSFFIPGLGQLVQGRILAALLFCATTYACYGLAATVVLIFMWVPGVLLHLWSIINAARFTPRGS
jgi:TM2 domain-containing membrane protein YozV